VWLHPDSSQIMRMHISMLSPGTILQQHTTDIDYSEIHFKGVAQSFWLPHRVTLSWELPGGEIYRNRHQYSDYRLFDVESDYKLAVPRISSSTSSEPNR
jgi:hypothetical protein